MLYIQNLLYISPKFPALSLVFEQNEMLGIQNCGVKLTIASCRNSSFSEAHKFVKPLLENVIYPDYKNIFWGFLLLLFKKPVSLLVILGFTLISSINIFAIRENVAALFFTLGWYPHLVNREESIDWIHADFGKGTATVALMLSEVTKKPFSFKVHAFDIYDQRLKYVDLLYKFKLIRASLIFSVHNYGKQIILQKSPQYEQKLIVNYTAIRPNDFQVIPPYLNSRRFVALGRLVPKKGFDVLVKASAILRSKGENFIVDIYGSGLEEENIRCLIVKHNLQDIVNLKGKYKNEELPEILADCIALLAPSVIDKNGDMDGIPTVIYEAMALGRTVISSRISGIPEVVQEGVNGLLCEAGNTDEIAQAMYYLLSNKDLAFQMGLNARQLVEKNHNYINTAKLLIETINIYLEMTECKKL